jgi:hypothetical protein
MVAVKTGWRFALRVILKAAALFVLANLVFAWANPLPTLGRLSIYNVLVPGRERLPYGENPAASYNLSLYSVEAMFSSHEISRSKPADEFRVLLMGDSSTWGYLLRPSDTLASAINAAGYTTPDGRHIRAYNLGYPVMSLTKDLMLLDEAMKYQPDMVVWLVTLESFPRQQQLFPPLVQNNPDRVRQLIEADHLNLDPNDPRFVNLSFADRTLIGRRRDLADWLRLQLYGPAWAATGIDQDIPATYTPRQENFNTDVTWQGYQPQALTDNELAFDVLAAGMARIRRTPALLVNEPIFISRGENSDLRYDAYYPRWAYDAYHALLIQTAEAQGWNFLDLWNAVSLDQFTDTAVHYAPAGARQLAGQLGTTLVRLANGG